MSDYISLYRQTLLDRQSLYDATIKTGNYSPFIYPWDTLQALWLFSSMILAQRVPERYSRFVRYFGFAATVGHSAWVVANCRTMNFAGGYGIGLMMAYGSMMASALLLCNDVRKDFVRLEVRKQRSDLANSLNGSAAKDVGTTHSQVEKRTAYSIYGTSSTRDTGDADPATEQYHLVWQPPPRSFLHLLDWSIDLMTAIRGTNWNYRVSPQPPIDAPHPAPPSDKVRVSPSASKGNHSSRATYISSPTLQAMRSLAFRDFLIWLFLIDTVKTIAITDPFFLGIANIDSPSPWPWLRHLTTSLPIATRVVRLLVSVSGVVTALNAIFSLSPLFFIVILPTLVDAFKLTYTPLLEPSMYPPYWLPITTIFSSGLPGFWGKFWHQLFRFSISEPARVVVEKMGLDPKSQVARVVQLVIAFALSGTIHATASLTSFSPVQSKPLNALAFFIIQALGCILQDGAVRGLQGLFPSLKKAPRMWKQIANGMFVLTYMYFTGPLLASEFARAGVWLYEPLPVSLWRGLGFGPGGRDEGWWCWSQTGRREVGWSDGNGRWWRRGLAIY